MSELFAEHFPFLSVRVLSLTAFRAIDTLRCRGNVPKKTGMASPVVLFIDDLATDILITVAAPHSPVVHLPTLPEKLIVPICRLVF
jgi:hypothetical protein